jgi:hypothetical protein
MPLFDNLALVVRDVSAGFVNTPWRSLPVPAR